MKEKVKISFPSFGIYNPCFKNLFEDLGCEVIPPPKATTKTIQKGSEAAPKFICAPLKWTLGSYIEILEKHKDITLVNYSNKGRCIQRAYYSIQTTILKELGYNFKGIYAIRPLSLVFDLKKITNASYPKIISAIRKGIRNMIKIEKQYFKSEGDIKVGVIGEIFTVLNNECNMDVIRKLKERKCYLEVKLLLSHFIKNALWREKRGFSRDIKRRAKKLFPEKIGGHGLFTIETMLYFIENKFDGVVFLRPMSCHPEIVVEPVLKSLSNKYDMPMPIFDFDETTSEVNMDNRLDGFIETMRMKKEK